MSFQDGDVVQLKSGGPEMTVQGTTNEFGHKIHCQWFDGPKLMSGSFNPATLDKIEYEKPGK